MSYDLKDQVAVVTGAGGILIREMAYWLAERGAHVVLINRSPAKIEAVQETIRQVGGSSSVHACDVTDPEGLAAIAEAVEASHGRVDILINGAGGNAPGATAFGDHTFFSLPPEDMQRVMTVNFQGTVLPCQIFGQMMTRQESGCIINISSMSGLQPLTRVVGYSAAKASINNFTQWLAVHMAQEYTPAIRVNAIAPGFFETEQNSFLLRAEDGSLSARGQTIVDHTPAGRFGTPKELLSTLEWLLHPGSGFVTGTVVPVDGGFSAFSGV
jgi:NAD(P)-dependent dehydrogenase (short-subunit alcohol dehydrogenase family)